METRLERPPGVLAVPDGDGEAGDRTGVLVLAGSSGRVDAGRARLLARHGVAAMSIQWFGGEGQPPGNCEVPLETFTSALDELASVSDRLAVLGVSKGAEAALLLAVRDPRVAVVAAFAPTHVVWANVGPGTDGRSEPARSSWTSAGVPLPFVPYDQTWTTDESPPAYRGLYAASLARYPREAALAAIPVERITGEVLVVAGEDDQVWASADFARAVVTRRKEHGRSTVPVTHPRAGHRIVLPGEEPVQGGMTMRRGGTPDADAELGALAWRDLSRLLRLRP